MISQNANQHYIRPVAEIQQIFDKNQEATLYCGNLDNRVDEELLAELFAQTGPIKSVYIPRDKVTGTHSGFGFIEFQQVLDCEYAQRILNSVKLYGKPIRCSKASQDRKQLDIGANLFIGNLSPDIDDKVLHDIFSSFGNVISTKVIFKENDEDEHGYGFVSYDSFNSSDNAIAALNGQFFGNRQITVSYAFKQDCKGERHGSTAERLLASKNT
ncbi:RNA recognition motif family protein [Cryptosporidium serpentis]